MKQKKKMLLAMAALSAVAVGVGTTSTFAWFQATKTVSKSAQNITSIDMDVTQVKSLGNVDLVGAYHITVSPIYTDKGTIGDNGLAASSTMEPMCYFDGTAAAAKSSQGAATGINFAYVTADSAVHYVQTQFNNSTPKIDYWRYYEITLTIDASVVVDNVTYTIATEMDGKTMTLSLNAGTNSHAFIYGLLAAGSSKPAYADADPEEVGDKASAATHKWTGISAATAGTTKYYFGMYVNGEDFGINDTVTGDITVSLSEIAAF